MNNENNTQAKDVEIDLEKCGMEISGGGLVHNRSVRTSDTLEQMDFATRRQGVRYVGFTQVCRGKVTVISGADKGSAVIVTGGPIGAHKVE